MISGEVISLDQEKDMQQPQEGYVERPKWQVWAARVGLVVFILFVIYQLIQIAGAGLL